MVSKATVVELKRRNLITYNYNDDLLRVSPFWFQLGVTFNDASVNAKLLTVPLEGIVKKCQAEINDKLKTLESRVDKLKKKEVSDPKVGEKAAKDVEQISKSIKSYISGIRERVCKDASKRTGVRMQEITTVGTRQFKGVELAPGAFKYTIGPDIGKAADSAQKHAKEQIDDKIEDLEKAMKAPGKALESAKEKAKDAYDSLKKAMNAVDPAKADILKIKDYSQEANDSLKSLHFTWLDMLNEVDPTVTGAVKTHAKAIYEKEASKKAAKETQQKLRLNNDKQIKALKSLKKKLENVEKGASSQIGTVLARIKVAEDEVGNLKKAFANVDKTLGDETKKIEVVLKKAPIEMKKNVEKKVGKDQKLTPKAMKPLTKDIKEAEKSLEKRRETFDDEHEKTWKGMKWSTTLGNLRTTTTALREKVVKLVSELDDELKDSKDPAGLKLTTQLGCEDWVKNRTTWLANLKDSKKSAVKTEAKALLESFKTFEKVRGNMT